MGKMASRCENYESARHERREKKTYNGKSLKPGGGGRFARFTDKLEAQGKSPESARKIAAFVGRKKYGAKKMAGWSSAGRGRA